METSKPRLLVVDDEPDMVAFLVDLLRKSGFDADGVRTGAAMHEALARTTYALILLDLRLKSEDGLTLARELRQRSAIPIIMISGASDETDRVLLLELAADDFLVKPFSPRELLARVRAVLRRYAVETGAPPSNAPRPPKATTRDHIRFGTWVLDLAERELVHQDGSPCPLTQAEFRLLEAFWRQPQRGWTRDQLLERAGGPRTEALD